MEPPAAIASVSTARISVTSFSSRGFEIPPETKILIATPEARTFFNVVPDFTTSPQLMRAGGKICYADTIDCVAWGNYTGSTEGVGTPFNATGGGLVSGRAVVRRLDVFAGSVPLFGDSFGERPRGDHQSLPSRRA